MPPAFCKVKEGCAGGGVHACVLSHDAADLFFFDHELLPSLEKWKHNTAVRPVLRDTVCSGWGHIYIQPQQSGLREVMVL